MPLDEVDRVAVSFQYGADLAVFGATKHGRVRDLVAVQVQDRQDRPVARGVEEAGTFPGALEGPRLRLAVADHSSDDEAGVVEGRAEGVGEDVAELAALVDRAGGGNAHVARHPAGRRELAEEPPYSRGVLGDLG